MKSLLEIATEIAEKAHEGQFRRDGVTPYISHPVAVKEIVKKWLDDYYTIRQRPNAFIFTHFEIINLIKRAEKSFNISGGKSYSFKELLLSLAISHDAIENGPPETLDLLKKKLIRNFSTKEIHVFLNALKMLTKPENSVYLYYILGARDNPFSRIIKVADIIHNISTRNGANTAGDRKRDKIAIEKYELAKYILLN